MKRQLTEVLFVALVGITVVSTAQAARVDFAGPLVAVEEDDGSGRYTGRRDGDVFVGHIDDQTFEGAISDGVTVTTFGCCIAAGSFEISNDVVLDFAAAGFLNQLSGSNAFSFGSVIDLVDIEGDTDLGGGRRLEVGLSYILPQTTFVSDNPPHQGFDADSALVTLYFVTEDDSRAFGGVYSAIGQVTAVPWPASVWLMGVGLPIVAGFARRQRKTG